MSAVPILSRLKTEDGTTYTHTKFYDDAALEKVKQLRKDEIMAKAKLGVHDDADMRMIISCPSVIQWNFFKRDYPEIEKRIHSKDEAERMKGCREIEILHPEWVVMHRR